MQRSIQVRIDEIYVPVKRRKALDVARVEALAGAILEEGLKVPITVRHDGTRWVLVEGLHRVEALRALGESEVEAYQVRARQR